MSDAIINCPKCDEPMRQLTAGAFTIDRCEKCYGIWLDKGERLKVVKDAAMTKAVDIGSEEKGEEMDEVRDIDCPRCGERMHHILDRAQKHVGFEYCRGCEGSFFDAGELRDLAETTISERIRAFFGH